MEIKMDIPQNFPMKLEENLWVLGNYYFNLYFVKGKKSSALIEVGISAVVDTVISQLEDMNESPDYLIVSHPHTDHVTGLEALCHRFPDACVVAGEGAEQFIKHPKAADVMIKEDRYMAQMLEERGIRPGRPSIEKPFFPDDHMAISKRQQIDLGDVMIECVNVKGHSPGNIVVNIPAIKALIVSDSLGFHFPGRGFLPIFFTGYKDYLTTLDYLESCRPSILGIAHQGPVFGDNVKKAFRESRNATYDLYNMITEAKKNNNDDKIADTIFNDCYKDEFKLYTEDNIRNCSRLLVKRVMETLN